MPRSDHGAILDLVTSTSGDGMELFGLLLIVGGLALGAFAVLREIHTSFRWRRSVVDDLRKKELYRSAEAAAKRRLVEDEWAQWWRAR